MPICKACLVCGKEFEVANARAETAKACSQACRGVLIAKAYGEARVHKNCKQCGVPMSLSVGRAARGNGVFCSWRCKDESLVGSGGSIRSKDGDLLTLRTGYVYERARKHPFASRGRVFKHRLVMEGMLATAEPDHHFLVRIDGCLYLRPEIVVHHKNEDRGDNRPTNLVACTVAAHKDIHAGRAPMLGSVWPATGNEIEAVPTRVACTCKVCGASFMKKRSEVLAGAGRFCSYTCFRAEQGKSGLPALVSRTCEMCEAPFMSPRNRVLKGFGRFCSNACKDRAKKRVGNT